MAPEDPSRLRSTRPVAPAPAAGRRSRFTPAKPSWPSQAKATSQKAKGSDRPQAAAPAADRPALNPEARGEPGPNEPALQSSEARRAKARMHE